MYRGNGVSLLEDVQLSPEALPLHLSLFGGARLSLEAISTSPPPA